MNASFTVALSGPAQAPVQIRYSTVNNTAVASGDYTAVTNAVLTIPQSQSSGSIVVVVKGDTLPEGAGDTPSESFFVDLQQVVSGPATIGSPARGTGTISDDDSPPTASISDATVNEGNDGDVTNAAFTVTLSRPAEGLVQIRYSTVNGSASAPEDYTAVTNAILQIQAGASTGTFNVAVNGDTEYEGDHSFFVDLIQVTSGPATIGADSRGAGSITEDDPAPPSSGGGGGGGGSEPALSISDVVVDERESATFTVTLLGNTTKTATVAYSTNNGSAAAGFDYQSTAGTLSFAPGQFTQTVTVTVIDDILSEASETFHLSLSGPSNATLLKAIGTGTILSSDQTRVQGGGGPNTTAKPALLPRMVLGPPTVTVGKNGLARMSIACAKASPITCTGSVGFETRVKPKFELGKKAFSAKKGKKVFVQIKLTPRALKLLKKQGTLRVQAVVVVKNSLKKNLRALPGLVTLKASQALLGKTTTQTLTATETTTPTATPKPTPKPKPKPKPKPEPEPTIIIEP